jgi:hypothetical protein
MYKMCNRHFTNLNANATNGIKINTTAGSREQSEAGNEGVTKIGYQGRRSDVAAMDHPKPTGGAQDGDGSILEA